MTYVQRSPTHRIDTRAVRLLISAMPDDWLVRSLEERDYGIDLQVELFDDASPTGGIALIQVKGTCEKVGGAPTLSGFPTKTVEYALLFPQPFFVFYVSIPDNKAHFVWLQKYAATELTQTTPNWRNQDSISIHFPEENVLPDPTSVSVTKISNIVTDYLLLPDGVLFLSRYESLFRCIDELETECDIAHWADAALIQLNGLKQLQAFIKHYDIGQQVDLIRLENLLATLKHDPYSYLEYQNEVRECEESLELVRTAFLSQEEVQAFEHLLRIAFPY